MYIASAFRNSANPVVWMRAVLMDLGFVGLIEEIEKRFGKGVTTFVIFCLLLAILIWLLRLMAGMVAEIAALQQGGSFWDGALAVTYRVALVLLIAVPVIGYLRFRFRQGVERTTKETQEAIEEHLSTLIRCRVDYETSRKELLDLMEEARSLLPDKADDAR